MSPQHNQVAVILASAGRPTLLADVISDLSHQTIQFTLVLSVPDDASLPPAHRIPDGAVLVRARGLAAQRNAGLEGVPDAEFVFFFDDDAVVRSDYLERGVRFFEDHPEVNGLTGRVLLDGATGAEIPRAKADNAIAQSLRTPIGHRHEPSKELYGCNFAFRVAGSGGEVFDPRLPLYSWLEDHDFARRLMRYGSLAKVEDCVIVHLGTKSGGRTAHQRLGYSQVMNPMYLWHRRSFSLNLALKETVFRVAKNLIRSLIGEEKQWRRLRFKGNLLALADLLRGRFTPERISNIPG